jgi:hypothetical protein
MNRRASLLASLSFALVAGSFLAGGANALEPSGSVVGVDPSVDASGPGGQRALELQGAVFLGDQIVASPRGLAQIKFIDDTRIVIGPNSRLKIDEFVFNPDNTVRKLAVNTLRGTFRFISGKSPHDAYSIRTPTMTIGVRGTIVDITVYNEDSAFSVPQGSATGCTTGGSCITINDPCQVYYAPRGGGGMQESTGLDLQRRLAYQFDLVDSALAPDFRKPPSGCSTSNPQLFEHHEGGEKTDRPTPSYNPPSRDGGEGGDQGGGEGNYGDNQYQ